MKENWDLWFVAACILLGVAWGWSLSVACGVPR